MQKKSEKKQDKYQLYIQLTIYSNTQPSCPHLYCGQEVDLQTGHRLCFQILSQRKASIASFVKKQLNSLFFLHACASQGQESAVYHYIDHTEASKTIQLWQSFLKVPPLLQGTEPIIVIQASCKSKQQSRQSEPLELPWMGEIEPACFKRVKRPFPFLDRVSQLW